MTQKEYNKLTLAQMKQKRWRTTRELRTNAAVIPKNTEVSIYHKGNGLFIEGQRCSHCNVTPRACKVNAEDVEEIL